MVDMVMILIFIFFNYYVVNLLLILYVCYMVYFINVKIFVLLIVKILKNNIVYFNCWEKSLDFWIMQCYMLFDFKIFCDIGLKNMVFM